MASNVGEKLSNDVWFAYNTLCKVFHYLEVEDLVRAAQVCKLWHWIAFDEGVWYSKILSSCEKHLAPMVDRYKNKVRNIEVDGLSRATVRLIGKSFRKMPNLRRVTLSDCRLLKLEQILDILNPDLEYLQIEQTHREPLYSFSLDFVKKFRNLKYFGILTFSYIEPGSLEALKFLPKLTGLFIYDEFINFNWNVLSELKSLRFLQLGGEMKHFLNLEIGYIFEILKSLKKLHRLKIEIYPICSYSFLTMLNKIPHLKHLELHGEIISRHDCYKFIRSLSTCTNLKSLTIEMDPELCLGRTIYDHAVRNSAIQKAAVKLKETLSYFYWFIPGYYLKQVNEVFGYENSIILRKTRLLPRTQKDVDIVSIRKLQKIMEDKMPKTKVFILVQNYNYRYCPKCKVNKKTRFL